MWYSPESNATENVQTTILCNEFENYAFKIIFASSRSRRVKWGFDVATTFPDAVSKASKIHVLC